MRKQRILLAMLLLLTAATAWVPFVRRSPAPPGTPGARETGTGEPQADAGAPDTRDGEQKPGIGEPPTTSESLRTDAGDPVKFPVDPAGTADRYAGAEELDAAVSEPDGQGRYRRVRLIRNPGGKIRLLRVEEDWRRMPPGPDTLLRQTAMAGTHILVQLREGAGVAVLEKALARHGLERKEPMAVPRGYRVIAEPPALESVPAMVAALSAEPFVAVAEPDYIYHVNETRPDDPLFDLQWGMEKIGMPRLWDTTRGTGGVVVAVFDTGIDLAHPDLAASIWVNSAETLNGQDDDGNGYKDDINGWDFYDANNNPSDVDGHGTHVAGTLGAIGNNATGVAGVAWNVRILPVKFFGTNAFGTIEGSAEDAAAGIYYVIALAARGVPVRVMNHSWGGSGYSQMLYDAFRIAAQYGILHVAAAGNGGSNLDNDQVPHYPSTFDISNMVVVANTTASDGLYVNSHYGALSVDLGAPGVNIWSANRGGGYSIKTGTSMATPHATGVAALLFDMFPDLTWGEVRDLLLAGADPLPALQGKCVTGGRLNAGNTFARIPPRILHEPLQNTAEPFTDFPAAAVIRPGLAYVKTAAVLWNTTGSRTIFETNVMQHADGNRYETALPGQPKGTAIYYMIRVETLSGLTTVHPANAPVALHRFDVTHPVSLRVFGYPAQVGATVPDYGDYSAAWGSTVEASAPLQTEPQDGIRWRCTGWSGAGSVPFSGDSSQVAFELKEPSYLLWWWKRQTALVQGSQPPGILEAVTWADDDTTTATITAPAQVTRNGVPYAFIGWEVDGARYPDSSSPAVNPAVSLPASAPRTALARYLPSAQDQDGDGLPDWWELFHFNHLGSSGGDDPDGDGFSNAAEFADRSNPASAASIPEGPAILHHPLPAFTPAPAPWRIAATVTDRVAVAVALLRWQRKGGPWNEIRMTADGETYSAAIPAPSSPGDVFSYQIRAEDTGTNPSASPVYAFTVRHPLLSFGPGEATLSVQAGKTVGLRMQLSNTGNADLVWETVTGIAEPVADLPGGWTHGGPNSQWHISTREFYSAPYAWFCGDPGGGLYNHSMDASLYTPPVTLGSDARLRFRHWPEMEYDGRPGYENYYWDGAVVEISRDGGILFESIDPVGGYPFRITPTASPFAAHRPCFGGATGGWHAAEFDLAAYAGETVQVRFRFGTDRYVEARGWFIDDIEFTWSVPWLEALATGTVQAGETAGVDLWLDASTLSPGIYRGVWTARGNAPGIPYFAVPLTLQVNAPPHATSMNLAADDPALFVLTWSSQTGRFYNISTRTRLDGDSAWNGLPGFTNLPGTPGFMSYTGVLETVPFKYFRVQERMP